MNTEPSTGISSGDLNWLMDRTEASLHSSSPKLPAAEGATRIIRALFSEFILDVSKEYEELEKGSSGAIQLKPGEFQIELLMFCLHCLDRAIFQNFGSVYRTGFMDVAVDISRTVISTCFSEELRSSHLNYFDHRYNELQATYSKLDPYADSSALRSSLFYHFGKRICYEAEAYNPATVAVMTVLGMEIFKMMFAQAKTLQ